MLRLSTLIVVGGGLVCRSVAFAMPGLEMRTRAPSSDATGFNATLDDPCSLAESPAVNASIQLSSWLECQVNSFFPYPENGAWDQAFASAFSSELKATFNDTHYGYDGWLQLYHNFNTTLGQAFSPFKHGFINSLAVPSANGDKGGFVYLIGWEGGTHALLKKDLYYTDATFAVVQEVDGQRKIVEFRESSNIPNSAPLPEPQEWTCNFS